MNIREYYGVDDLYFYKLVRLTGENDISISVCSTKDFSTEIGVTREISGHSWRHDGIMEDELKVLLSDLFDERGNIFFADVKKYYKSLDQLLKDYYIMFSINSAIINTKKPEVKHD